MIGSNVGHQSRSWSFNSIEPIEKNINVSFILHKFLPIKRHFVALGSHLDQNDLEKAEITDAIIHFLLCSRRT